MLRKFPCVLVARSRLHSRKASIVRCASYGIESHAESSNLRSPPPPFEVPERTVLEQHEGQNAESLEPLADFAMLGVRRSVRLALHEAFSNVRIPTACQTAFIPAILGRKDVILKDWTGTGK